MRLPVPIRLARLDPTLSIKLPPHLPSESPNRDQQRNSGICECQQMDTCHVIQYKVVTAGFGMESFSSNLEVTCKWMYVSPQMNRDIPQSHFIGPGPESVKWGRSVWWKFQNHVCSDVPHVKLASEAMYLPAQPDRAIPLRRCGSSPNLVSAPMNIENRWSSSLFQPHF